MPQRSTLDLLGDAPATRHIPVEVLRRSDEDGQSPGKIAHWLATQGVFVSPDVVRRWLRVQRGE